MFKNSIICLKPQHENLLQEISSKLWDFISQQSSVRKQATGCKQPLSEILLQKIEAKKP